MDETHLCSQWQLSMKCGSSQEEVQVNIPKLYLVPAQDLNSPVLVFEENPNARSVLYVFTIRQLGNLQKLTYQLLQWHVGLN